VAQSLEVVVAYCGRCFNFDAHDFALAILEEHLDLDLVLRPVMEQFDSASDQVACRTSSIVTKPFEQWTELAAGPGRGPGVSTEQVRGDIRIYECELGRVRFLDQSGMRLTWKISSKRVTYRSAVACEIAANAGSANMRLHRSVDYRLFFRKSRWEIQADTRKWLDAAVSRAELR
jgi:hypothetical protein